MGARKPAKKQAKKEQKGLFAGLFGLFAKKEAPKKKGTGKTTRLKEDGARPEGPTRSKTAGLKKPRPEAAEFTPPPQPLASIADIDDDLFGGLELASEPPAAPSAPQAPVMPAAPGPAAPVGTDSLLFPEGVDNALDSLFDSFGDPEAPAGPPPAPQAAPPPPPPPPPSQPAAPPPPQPAAQPAAPAPAAPAAAAPQQDGLVSIGKLLVDQNTLKKIINNAEKSGAGLYTTTRIISAGQGQDLDSLLQEVDRCQGVSGSLIVGRDGLVIASTMPAAFDKDLVGAIACSMQTNLDVQSKKMKLGAVRQVILDTEAGVLVLVSLQVGVLVVMSQDLGQLDLAGVLQTVLGSAEKV